MLFKCRLNMIKATFSSGFFCFLSHFVFAPKNHISFLQSCAFGFAVIKWTKLTATNFFLFSKFFQIQEPGIILIITIKGHQLMMLCFYAHYQLLTKVFQTPTLRGDEPKV